MAFTKTDEEAFAELTAPIETKVRPGKGSDGQEYIPHEEVRERLLSVYGLNWNLELLREIVTGDEIAVAVRLHYPTESGMKFKDGYAGFRYQPNVGLGNQLKGSASLAMVKAASLMGITVSQNNKSTSEQHAKIKELLSQLKGKIPTDDRLTTMTYQECDDLIKALNKRVRETEE